MLLTPFRRAIIRRSMGLLAAIAFLWSFVLAAPAGSAVQSALHPAKRLGLRVLSDKEMDRIVGSQGGMHPVSRTFDSGGTFPWEGNSGGANTGNGNKLTSIPIVEWTARGGMPLAFTLYHSSMSAHNGELGQHWTHSYDIYLALCANMI